MAHGYLNQVAGDRYHMYSAGVETHGLNPEAVFFMKEDGVDISHHQSNHIDEYADIEFELVLTVCDHAKESCPVLPGARNVVHFSFSDPSKAEGTEQEITQAFRSVRDQIKHYVSGLIAGIELKNAQPA